MTKRKSLTRKNARNAGTIVGRVVVSAERRDVISPGPSREAVEEIERFEASTLRAEQRLGLVRLA